MVFTQKPFLLLHIAETQRQRIIIVHLNTAKRISRPLSTVNNSYHCPASLFYAHTCPSGFPKTSNLVAMDLHRHALLFLKALVYLDAPFWNEAQLAKGNRTVCCIYKIFWNPLANCLEGDSITTSVTAPHRRGIHYGLQTTLIQPNSGGERTPKTKRTHGFLGLHLRCLRG